MRLTDLLLFFCFSILVTGCSWGKNSPNDDSPVKGTIKISADQAFEPVLREQIHMYEISYPETKINAEFKSEIDCIKDLINDPETRMVITTRKLNAAEESYLLDSLRYIPQSDRIAYDAVVVLLNKNNADTLFTMQRLRDQLLGKINRHQQIIFDGKNTTSTVRYIQDSLLKGAMFDTSVVSGAVGTEEVIDFVSKNSNAIGLIGFNRIGNPEDSAQVRAMRNLRFGYVQCDLCDEKPFVKPMQESINTKRYPLTRSLYYIMKENYQGLGTGFTSFLKYERGQLIFRRAYLGTIMDFDIRNIRYNQNIPVGDEL